MLSVLDKWSNLKWICQCSRRLCSHWGEKCSTYKLEGSFREMAISQCLSRSEKCCRQKKRPLLWHFWVYSTQNTQMLLDNWNLLIFSVSVYGNKHNEHLFLVIILKKWILWHFGSPPMKTSNTLSMIRFMLVAFHSIGAPWIFRNVCLICSLRRKQINSDCFDDEKCTIKEM